MNKFTLHSLDLIEVIFNGCTRGCDGSRSIVGGAKGQPPADTIVRRPLKECAVIDLTTVPMHSTRAGAMHGEKELLFRCSVVHVYALHFVAPTVAHIDAHQVVAGLGVVSLAHGVERYVVDTVEESIVPLVHMSAEDG